MPPVPAELVHGVDSWAWRGPFNRVPFPLPHPASLGENVLLNPGSRSQKKRTRTHGV